MGRAGYGKYPPQAYTWNNRPAAADWAGELIQITDVGLGGSLWISTGVLWKPVNGRVTLAASAAAIASTNTTAEETLLSLIIKAGLLGLDGSLEILTTWTTTNGANDKTMRIRFNSTTLNLFLNQLVTAVAHVQQRTIITNRGVANSQMGAVTGLDEGTSTGTIVTAAVDTSAETTLYIRSIKEVGTEICTLERHRIELVTP